jgi:hypothetical protein
MKFYLDDNKDPRAEDSGEFALLASFLESDIQGDKEAAIELLHYLEKKQGERIGNAYALNFDDKYVHIQSLEGLEEKQSYLRNPFFQAVEGWIVFISD